MSLEQTPTLSRLLRGIFLSAALLATPALSGALYPPTGTSKTFAKVNGRSYVGTAYQALPVLDGDVTALIAQGWTLTQVNSTAAQTLAPPSSGTQGCVADKPIDLIPAAGLLTLRAYDGSQCVPIVSINPLTHIPSLLVNVAAGQITGLATVATTGSAADLGSGILPAGRLAGVAPLLSNNGSDYNPATFRTNIGAFSSAGGTVAGNVGITGSTLFGTSSSLGSLVSTKAGTQMVPGLVGDASTNNNTAMANLESLVAPNGGSIKLPCGEFVLTATPTMSVADNQHIDFGGSGVDCTTLHLTGAINGPAFNYLGPSASASVHDMTICTDQPGTSTGILLSLPTVNTYNIVSGQNTLYNLNFNGCGGRATNLNYFARAIDIENVSQDYLTNIDCLGLTSSYGGHCVYMNGLPEAPGYGVLLNINTITCSTVLDCLYVNSYVQGISINDMNSTSGYQGITMNASATGFIDQFLVTNSQFGYNRAYDVLLAAPPAHLGHAMFTNDYFLEGDSYNSTGGGVFVNGIQAHVDNSSFLETIASTNPMLSLVGTNSSATGNTMTGGVSSDTAIFLAGTNLTAAGNTINNFTTAISVGAGSPYVALSLNHLSGNTNDYTVSSTATNVNITDANNRLIAGLPTCSSAITASTFRVVNASAPAYNTAFSGTGAVVATAMCNGGTSTWVAH